MKMDAHTKHLTPSLVQEYLAHTLSECRESQIETHLAGCSECAELVRTSRALAHLWTAAASPEARAAAVVRQMETVVAQSAGPIDDPETRQHLARWREKLASFAGRALEEIAAATREAAAAPLQLARVIEDWGWVGEIHLAPIPVATRGAAAKKSADRNEGVVEKASVPPTAGISVQIVHPSGRSRKLEVIIAGLPQDCPSPFVLLVPVVGGLQPQGRTAKRDKATPIWKAEFNGVEPGDYTVALAPVRL